VLPALAGVNDLTATWDFTVCPSGLVNSLRLLCLLRESERERETGRERDSNYVQANQSPPAGVLSNITDRHCVQ